MVADPDEPHLTVYDTWKGALPRPEVGRLGGGGSDFGPFLQHIGVPAVNMQYGDSDAHGYPVYHSVYDNFHWMEKFGDPEFRRHVACTKLWGFLALRLANVDVLPFNYNHYARELARYEEVVENALTLSLQGQNAPPGGFSSLPLKEAITRFSQASEGVSIQAKPLMGENRRHRWRDALFGEPAALASRRCYLNDRMMLAERSLLDPDGLGGLRSWYRHMVYAPAIDDGYGSVAFPGITDALTLYARGEPGYTLGRVQHEIFRVARAIDRAAAVLHGRIF
eukprot:TRINITY_DN33410_c0_g1_i1.p1 TRINITY_DN33410_c0_g1~~TRINITY_DN33410_c0_g1_i1.p1  ORF type:complete len:324 (-),score=53.97 TRINITY_DN33410_c0_g1_i1:661-1500(-)